MVGKVLGVVTAAEAMENWGLVVPGEAKAEVDRYEFWSYS